jgi:hypothetical protein
MRREMKNLKRLFETGTERATERMYARDLKQGRCHKYRNRKGYLHKDSFSDELARFLVMLDD